MFKIAKTTSQSLDEVRKMSKSDFDGWMAFFSLEDDLEKEAYEKARSGSGNKHSKSNGKIDVSNALLDATLKGEKTIDLEGLV